MTVTFKDFLNFINVFKDDRYYDWHKHTLWIKCEIFFRFLFGNDDRAGLFEFLTLFIGRGLSELADVLLSKRPGGLLFIPHLLALCIVMFLYYLVNGVIGFICLLITLSVSPIIGIIHLIVKNMPARMKHIETLETIDPNDLGNRDQCILEGYFEFHGGSERHCSVEYLDLDEKKEGIIQTVSLCTKPLKEVVSDFKEKIDGYEHHYGFNLLVFGDQKKYFLFLALHKVIYYPKPGEEGIEAKNAKPEALVPVNEDNAKGIHQLIKRRASFENIHFPWEYDRNYQGIQTVFNQALTMLSPLSQLFKKNQGLFVFAKNGKDYPIASYCPRASKEFLPNVIVGVIAYYAFDIVMSEADKECDEQSVNRIWKKLQQRPLLPPTS